MEQSFSTVLMDFYLAHRDRVIWEAAPGVLVILSAALLALFGSVHIVLATWRSR